VDEGADFFSFNGESNGMRIAEIKDEDREIIVQTKREGGGVHHTEALAEGVDKGDIFVSDGVGVFFGVFVVDPVDLGGFEDDFGSNLVGPEGRGGIGGEVGIAGAGDENNHPLLFKVPHGATKDEGLGNLIHGDGGLDAGSHIHFFEAIHDGETVDDGGEHAHVISRGAIYTASLALETAEDVAPANDDADFNAHFVNFLHLAANPGKDDRIDRI